MQVKRMIPTFWVQWHEEWWYCWKKWSNCTYLSEEIRKSSSTSQKGRCLQSHLLQDFFQLPNCISDGELSHGCGCGLKRNTINQTIFSVPLGHCWESPLSDIYRMTLEPRPRLTSAASSPFPQGLRMKASRILRKAKPQGPLQHHDIALFCGFLYF